MGAPQPTIVIDGFNLALERGTGVATYGRNLSYVCRDLGARVDLLYGKPTRPAASPLLTDIRFSDPPEAPGLIASLQRRLAAALPAPFGIASFQVPLSGDVIRPHAEGTTPHADTTWNATDLFRRAEAHFRMTGSLATVRHKGPADIVHWTYPVPVRMPGAVNIYTLHDLVPLRLPYTTLDDKSYYLRLARKIVQTADHIVTVSETSRTDIIRLLGCPEDKVTNTYQSVTIPSALREKTDQQIAAEIEGAFGLPYKGYLLFYGAIEPKKNVGRLIEAYLTSGVDLPLVLIGSLAWKSNHELRLLEAARGSSPTTRSAANRIRHFDYAPFSLLVSAIRGARATVFPSLYEGFGLPILESMMLGTPVITSREGATAEIAGEAALLVDPYDVRDIAEALRVVCDKTECAQDLACAGLTQAASFDAAHYATRVERLQLLLTRPGRH